MKCRPRPGVFENRSDLIGAFGDVNLSTSVSTGTLSTDSVHRSARRKPREVSHEWACQAWSEPVEHIDHARSGGERGNGTRPSSPPSIRPSTSMAAVALRTPRAHTGAATSARLPSPRKSSASNCSEQPPQAPASADSQDDAGTQAIPTTGCNTRHPRPGALRLSKFLPAARPVPVTNQHWASRSVSVGR
jgi:hypothetical protein